MSGTERSRKKETWKTKLADLIKFLMWALTTERPRNGRGEGFCPPPHPPQKATVAKQMAEHIFKPLFNTVTYFFSLLALYAFSQKSYQLSPSQRKCQGAVVACAFPRRSGRERRPRTSASCGPGCRMSAATEGQALHQNEPPQRFTANPSPINSPFWVLNVYTSHSTFPPVSCLLPDSPVRSLFIIPFHRETNGALWLLALRSPSCVIFTKSLSLSGPQPLHVHNETGPPKSSQL